MARHRLRRRYGRASSKGGPKVVYRMLTGGRVWAVPGSDMQIMWSGPGGRLFLGWNLMKPGGHMTVIEHPTADGNYTDAKRATAAVKAFLEAK